MVEKTTTGLWPSLYDPFRTWATRMNELLSPATDARLAGDTYRITLELPGVEEQDVELTIHDGLVTVKGEKTAEREEEGDSWFFSERQYGAFSRAFRLPPDADESKVEAHLKDGVLSVTVPKSVPKAAAAKKVTIHTG